MVVVVVEAARGAAEAVREVVDRSARAGLAGLSPMPRAAARKKGLRLLRLPPRLPQRRRPRTSLLLPPRRRTRSAEKDGRGEQFGLCKTHSKHIYQPALSIFPFRLRAICASTYDPFISDGSCISSCVVCSV